MMELELNKSPSSRRDKRMSMREPYTQHSSFINQHPPSPLSRDRSLTLK